MTLDEAIKRSKEKAEDLRKQATIKQGGDNPTENFLAEICLKCAEEHEQLVEWLKDYKRLLIKENKE